VLESVSVVECDAPALELSPAVKAALLLEASLPLKLWEPVFEYDDVSVVPWLKLETSLRVLEFVVLWVFEYVLLTVRSGPLLYPDRVAVAEGSDWLMELLWLTMAPLLPWSAVRVEA
jgi:hypothetical protein